MTTIYAPPRRTTLRGLGSGGWFGGGPRPPGTPSPAPTNSTGAGMPPGWNAPYGVVSGYPVEPGSGNVLSWDTYCTKYPQGCPKDWKCKLDPQACPKTKKSAPKQPTTHFGLQCDPSKGPCPNPDGDPGLRPWSGSSGSSSGSSHAPPTPPPVAPPPPPVAPNDPEPPPGTAAWYAWMKRHGLPFTPPTEYHGDVVPYTPPTPGGFININPLPGAPFSASTVVQAPAIPTLSPRGFSQPPMISVGLVPRLMGFGDDGLFPDAAASTPEILYNPDMTPFVPSKASGSSSDSAPTPSPFALPDFGAMFSKAFGQSYRGTTETPPVFTMNQAYTATPAAVDRYLSQAAAANQQALRAFSSIRSGGGLNLPKGALSLPNAKIDWGSSYASSSSKAAAPTSKLLLLAVVAGAGYLIYKKMKKGK